MSYLAVFDSFQRSTTKLFSMRVLPLGTLWIDSEKMLIQYWFFSHWKLIFSRNTSYISSIKASVDVFILVKHYAIVHFGVWLLGMETWYTEIVKNCIVVWIDLINESIYSKKLSRFLPRWINQQISICSTLSEAYVAGKCPCMQTS